LFARLRLVIAAVEKTFAVFGPGSARELHPLDFVFEIFTGIDVADLPLLPIRSGRGDAISE
jgi:hypothetical protein